MRLIGLRTFVLAFVFAVVPFATLCAQTSEEPETVFVTYHPKAGQDAALLQTIQDDWAALRRLKLVDEKPHVLVRGKDADGSVVFLEVFTWVSGDAADHVPPEVQAIWKRMGALVEPKEGHPGIDFRQVSLIAGDK